MKREAPIAVTGLGPVTSVGIGREAFWNALAAGRSGVRRIRSFDPEGLSCRIAAELPDFDPQAYFRPRRARRAERFSQFAVAGASLALEDAKVTAAELDPERCGVVVGTAYAGARRLESEYRRLLEEGPKAVDAELSMLMMPNAAAACVSIEFGLRGPVECTASACAASGHAIVRAAEWIRSGRADAMLAGGTDAAITRLSLAAFCAARALATDNDHPEQACRPFDARRSGYVFGEGATMLLLESEQHARARGARIFAWLLGSGSTGDAFNLARPDPEGNGARRAMEDAIASSDIDRRSIGYVNAHAASTPVGDAAEARAIRAVFGDAPPPTSSTKAMHGHMLGAAAATEAAAAVLALQHGLLPPTINYEVPDPDCDLDVVPNHARASRLDLALSNSLGLGGVNCCLAFARA